MKDVGTQDDRRATLRTRLREGQLVRGVGLTWPNAGVVEGLAMTGFDCVFLDHEHTWHTEETLEHLVRAAHLHGAAVIARSDARGSTLSRYFDIGIDGVSVPSVSTVRHARAVVDAVKYPPVGSRSLGLGRSRSWGYADEAIADHVARANQGTVVLIQVEDRAGVENLDHILTELPEIDGVIVGLVDLAQSMGHPGDTSHRDVVDQVDLAVRTVHGHARALGFGVRTPDDVTRLTGTANLLVASSAAVLAAGVRSLWDEPSGGGTLSERADHQRV
jgi:2-keto-3-deoxy-L-rhamnonate aldolase RhmA